MAGPRPSNAGKADSRCPMASRSRAREGEKGTGHSNKALARPPSRIDPCCPMRSRCGSRVARRRRTVMSLLFNAMHPCRHKLLPTCSFPPQRSPRTSARAASGGIRCSQTRTTRGEKKEKTDGSLTKELDKEGGVGGALGLGLGKPGLQVAGREHPHSTAFVLRRASKEEREPVRREADRGGWRVSPAHVERRVIDGCLPGRREEE